MPQDAKFRSHINLLRIACQMALDRLDDVDGNHPDTLSVMNVLEQALDETLN